MKQRSLLATRLQMETAERLRETRVRSIYAEWCGVYGKKADEARFQIFRSNFILMESYADENGQTVQLNKWYDCTEEEYTAQTSEKPLIEEVDDRTEKTPDYGFEQNGSFEGKLEPREKIESDESKLGKMRLQEAEQRAIEGKLRHCHT